MKILLLSVILNFIFSSIQALACTTVFFPSKSVVAKNLDWDQGQGYIYINKRNVLKKATFILPPQKALEWTSKYMSLTFTQSGREFPWEGINEAGLSVNIMNLDETELPSFWDAKPAVIILQWVQYILDTSATVAEAIDHAEKIKVTGPRAGNHFMVCDALSHCAVFEYIAGKLVVHTKENLPYQALTNNTYEDSTNYLNGLLKTKTDKEILKSEDYGSLERFSRAALLSKFYSINEDIKKYALGTLKNVSQPVSSETPTQWSMVFDLKTKEVQFLTLQMPNIKSIDLTRFNPSCKDPVKMLNMNSLLMGDVTHSFKDYSESENTAFIEEEDLPWLYRKVLQNYPASTQCL